MTVPQQCAPAGAVPSITRANWRKYAGAAIDRERWTAVVPAAGKGTRLGYHLPKILFPVNGRSILEWLMRLLEPRCESVIFVLSPEGAAPVEDALRGLAPGRYRIAIQETPLGMGDAVQRGLELATSEYVGIVWGDQVALRPSSVEACLRLQQSPLAPAAVCPLLVREQPYIHFERDDAGRITALKQAREGDEMPATGNSDTGLFTFRTAVLKDLFERADTIPGVTGRATKESNFLPLIVEAAREHCVLTPALVTLEETVGVNSASDAAAIADFLGSAEYGGD